MTIDGTSQEVASDDEYNEKLSVCSSGGGKKIGTASSLSETFSGSVTSDARINLFLRSFPVAAAARASGKSAGKSQSKSRREFREMRSKKNLGLGYGREHFRKRFIWLVGTIKLFSRDHVKNSAAESILLEQRDHVRRPFDAMRRVERQP